CTSWHISAQVLGEIWENAAAGAIPHLLGQSTGPQHDRHGLSDSTPAPAFGLIPSSPNEGEHMQRWPILFVLFSSPAFGQDSIEDKGRTCTVITDTLARLVCYDEVFAAPSVSPSPALAAFDTPWQVDLFNEGGLNSTMATGWDGETSVDFFSIQAVSDISYVAFTVNEEGTEQVAIGSFDVMRLYNNERLVKIDWGKHERTRMVTCASFTNTETDKNYVVLNFLEEQPSAASGESPLSTASHYAAPLSLTHDGNFSCDEATHSYFIADIPHEDRLPKPANASAPEEPFDGRTRESALELMVDAIMSDDLYFDLGVTTQRHLADIEFLMTVDPVGIDANSVKVGSRVAY